MHTTIFESIWSNQNQAALSYLSEDEQKRHLHLSIQIDGIEEELEHLYGSYTELFDIVGTGEPPIFIPSIETENGSTIPITEYEAQLQEKYSSYGKEAEALMRKARETYTAAMRDNPEYLYSEAERLTGLLTIESLEGEFEFAALCAGARKKTKHQFNPDFPEWAFSFRSLEFMFHEAVSAIILPLRAYVSTYPRSYVWTIYADFYTEPPKYVGEGKEPELGVKLRKLYSNKAQELFDAVQNFELEFDLVEAPPSKKPKRRYIKSPKGTTPISEGLALLTKKGYESSFSFRSSSRANAFLYRLPADESYTYKDGQLYAAGNNNPIALTEFRDMKTKQTLSLLDYNQALLALLYTIIYDHYTKTGELLQTIDISITELAKKIGLPSNLSNERIHGIIDEIQKFQTVTGVIKNPTTQRKSPYAVLTFQSYDEDKRILTFSSPYCCKVISEAEGASIIKNKPPKLKASSGGGERKLPSHTHQVKSSLCKARNQVAVAIVLHLVPMIEQSGKNGRGYHIKVSTLMQEVPQLEEGFNRALANKNGTRFLKDTFTAVYRLLKTDTTLCETYPDIQIPDASNPANIPTPKNLEMVIEIPHKGKRRPS